VALQATARWRSCSILKSSDAPCLSAGVGRNRTPMKTSRVSVLTALALLIGLIAACWCMAQPSHTEPATDNSIGSHQLESFVDYLQDTKQTNTLQRFNDYANVTIVSRSSADLGVRLHILDDIRNGRTNEAIRMLELQMRSDAVGFAASYRELPLGLRGKVGLTALREARDYCRKYPTENGQPDLDEILTNAFKLLDDKASY